VRGHFDFLSTWLCKVLPETALSKHERILSMKYEGNRNLEFGGGSKKVEQTFKPSDTNSRALTDGVVCK
jgi:hypothetical protein